MADIPLKTAQSATRMPSRRAVSEEDLRDRLGLPSRPEQRGLAGRFFRGLRTFLWVAPLSVLLWIYAEREQITPLTDVPAAITVRSNAPDRLVTLISPEDKHVYLDLSGPRFSLTKVRDQLLDARTQPLEIVVPDDLANGEHEISVVDRIGKNDVFTQNAVTVTRSRPAVRVKIETKATRTIPVKVRPEEKTLGPVVFDPETVTVEGPAALFSTIPVDRLVVYADMSKFAGRTPGHYEEQVNIVFPFKSENVTLPKTVMAKVDIQKSDQMDLPSIPVIVQLPAGLVNADRYKIKADVTLPNVRVSGPPSAIQSLKDGKFIPAAVLELTPDDFTGAGGDKSKRLRPDDYRMPKDVSVTNHDREINYTISDRGG